MNCKRIKEDLRAGRDLARPEVARHLDDCAACRVVTADGAGLARELGTVPPADRAGADAVFAELRAAIDADAGLVSWVRSQPTWLRLGLAAALFLGISVLTLAYSPRPDLAVFPTSRMALTVALFAAIGLALLARTLRPLHRLPATRSNAVLAIAALVVVPLTLSLLPVAHRALPVSLMGGGGMLLAKAEPCFTYGMVTSIPILLALWLLERSGQRGRGRSVLAAAGASLGGSLALHLFCPITVREHLLVGHSTVPIGVLLLWAAVTAVTGRRRAL